MKFGVPNVKQLVVNTTYAAEN